MSDKLQPNSADKKLAKSISLNIHRHFRDFSRFRLFTQRVKGQKGEKARGYWLKPHFPNPYRRNWAEVCRTFCGAPQYVVGVHGNSQRTTFIEATQTASLRYLGGSLWCHIAYSFKWKML